MQDRQPGAPGQYKATLTAAEFQKMQAGEQFIITMVRDDQPIVEGTPYSKAAVLPDALAATLCPAILNPTPADAFAALQVGKAPAGYGYGEQCLYVQSANIDDEFLNSIAQIYGKLSNQAAQIRFAWNGYYYFGTLWNSGHEGYGTLTAICYASGHRVQRICTAGVWGEWEHENPPLVLGVEYRTTKRFAKAAIYMQALSLGGVAVGGSTTVSHEIDDIDYAIRATLLDGSGTITGAAEQRFTQTEVSVTLPADMGGKGVYAILEYTKTTG